MKQILIDPEIKLKDVRYKDLLPVQRALYLYAKNIYFDRKVRKNYFHVTSIFNSPRQYFLRLRHGKEIWDKLTVGDLDNFFWMLNGTAIHNYLTYFRVKHTWQDVKRLEMKVNNSIITGRPDMYFLRKRILIDYKTTSVWTLPHIVDDYKYQLNLYRLMLWKEGYSVKKMFIEAILKDWQRAKIFEHNYPQSFRQIIEVPFIDLKEMYEKTLIRVLFFESCQNLNDDKLPYCTKQERWSRGDTWALMKKGKKRAIKVFNSEEAAIAYGKTVPGAYIEYRPGKNQKCEMFCDVKEYCNQYWESKDA